MGYSRKLTLQFSILALALFAVNAPLSSFAEELSPKALEERDERVSNNRSYLHRMEDIFKDAAYLEEQIELSPDYKNEIEELRREIELAEGEAVSAQTSPNNFSEPSYAAYNAAERRHRRLFAQTDNLIKKMWQIDSMLKTVRHKTSATELRQLRTELLATYLAEPEYDSYKDIHQEITKLSNEYAAYRKSLSPQAATDQLPEKVRVMVRRILILPLKFDTRHSEEYAAKARINFALGLNTGFLGTAAGLIAPAVYSVIANTDFGNETYVMSALASGGACFFPYWIKTLRNASQLAPEAYKCKHLENKEYVSSMCNVLLKPVKTKRIEPIERISDETVSSKSSRERIR